MKAVNKIIIISMAILLWNCAEADKEFVHDSTTISQMICRAKSDGTEFRATIVEYDKNGNQILTDEFTEKDVTGGYGRVFFEVSQSMIDEVDLTNILVIATLSWDQTITPTLSGRHDITGEGIVITVKSGIGTTRSYRIQGEYKELIIKN
jgi:small nuclear ribonucleoprotein (snRNP)-like protein